MVIRYLSEVQLAGFKNYKYSAIDTSPVSKYVCHPFWNSVVELVPKWVAPNVLTFVGFLFCVTNYVMLSWYDFDFYASSDLHPQSLPVPALVWLFCALFQFLSHTLDGIDGKQARRTDSSGPLGELFDHGLDSWTTLFFSNAFISTYGREDYSIPVYRIFFLLLAIHIGFMLSHFEKYNTGVLYLPWAYDISQITMMIVYTVTFLFGYKIWKVHVPFTTFNGAHCLEIAIYCGGCLLSLPITICNIYQSYKNKTGKMHPPLEMLRPLVSTLTLGVLCTIWMLLSKDDILFNHPRIFFFMLGTIFSNILCRLIVSQMSSTRCELFNWFLLPLAAITAFASFVPYVSGIEYHLLCFLTVLVTLAHSHYCCVVVYQMGEFFDIPIFSVKKKLMTD